jgi:hypothetical protein
MAQSHHEHDEYQAMIAFKRSFASRPWQQLRQIAPSRKCAGVWRTGHAGFEFPMQPRAADLALG